MIRKYMAKLTLLEQIKYILKFYCNLIDNNQILLVLIPIFNTI